MDNKIALRKEAVRRHLSGESQVRISRALGRSACWVRYWLTRYNPDDPDGSLQDRSRAPHQPHSHWLAETRQQALTSRQQRQSGSRPGYEHALISAEAIHYELAHLGVEPAPPPRTIHYWLKQEGLVSARQPADAMPSSKPYPHPLCRAVNDLQQLDLKGPLYLQGSAQKHYLLVVRDVCSRGVALGVAQDRRAATIAAFLVTAWQTRGLPKVLQMDNGLEFRGSNRYPRPSAWSSVWLWMWASSRCSSHPTSRGAMVVWSASTAKYNTCCSTAVSSTRQPPWATGLLRFSWPSTPPIACRLSMARRPTNSSPAVHSATWRPPTTACNAIFNW